MGGVMAVQTLDRGIELLRLLAEFGPEGGRLTDLQRRTGLTKPTVHRILVSLKNNALVEQVDSSKRYRLGPGIWALGFHVFNHMNELQKRCEEDLALLARKSGDTTFLVVPSGAEAICIDRHSGPYRETAFTIDIGVRRPLCVGATGIALLASMAPSFADKIFETSQRALLDYPAPLKALRAAVTLARQSGYAFSDGTLLREVRGVAMAVRDDQGKVIASVGIASSLARIDERRVPALLQLLRAGVRQIEKRIAVPNSGMLRPRHTIAAH
jgi:DNA-binding IclR family transcriptional regulator